MAESALDPVEGREGVVECCVGRWAELEATGVDMCCMGLGVESEKGSDDESSSDNVGDLERACRFIAGGVVTGDTSFCLTGDASSSEIADRKRACSLSLCRTKA